jgi:hypothetical protein
MRADDVCFRLADLRQHALADLSDLVPRGHDRGAEALLLGGHLS